MPAAFDLHQGGQSGAGPSVRIEGVPGVTHAARDPFTC
jgi:hypothetical protein